MIKGTTGRGGSGKSLCTVARLWQMHQKGRPVWSNTPLVDLRVKRHSSSGLWLPVNAASFGEYWSGGKVTQFSDIYDLDNCEVLLDEIASWMPSHKHQQIPDEVRRFLAQDRREGVNVWWTHRTQRIFHEVLENTAEVTACQRYGPWIVATSVDPQDRAGKGVRRIYTVKPELYDLYQTFARVGTSSGEGYGLGKRLGYGGHNLRVVQCWGDQEWDIYVRPEQFACLMRKFGPERLRLRREEHHGVRYVYS